MRDIAEWLASLGVGEYAQRFADNAIDLSVLRDLTEQDLKDLGVLLGHRRKILRAIAELDGVAPTPAETATEPSARDEAERRHLTVMICDLVGSTALSARLDPEDMRAVMDAYHAACARIMLTYDGFLAEFRGDGILAYFGYPRAHEDDAERTVRAGLDIIAAVARLETRAAEPLAVRIGIATGLVVVGDLSGGECVAGARCGRGHAEPCSPPSGLGRAWDDRRRRLHAPAARRSVPSARPRPARGQGYCRAGRGVGGRGRVGLREPLRGGPRGGSDRSHRPRGRDRFPAGTPTPRLEGRRADRADLGRAGDRQVPPCGGSRRAHRRRAAHALALPMLALPHQQRASSVHRPVGASGGVQGRRYVRATPRQAGSAPRHGRIAGSSRQRRFLLRCCRSRSASGIAPLALSPTQQRRRTLAALLDQFEGLARRQPILLLFEDAHWADATSLELLDLTVERMRQLPVLALFTFRPEFEPPWVGLPNVGTLTLGRLDRNDVESMVARVTGGRALPAEVMKQIVAKTDGNPLFVEELTKAVLEAGILVEDAEGYRLDGPLPPLAIPATLQDSLMARLDRLAPVREIGQIGAAIGREFSYSLLRALVGRDETALKHALAQLEQAELVFRRGEPPEAVYSFKHALVRDAAYESLLKSRRQQLHGQIARALEERFADIVASQPEIAAHHFTEAGLVERAIDYWLKAGQHAARRSANAEALNHLARGLELLPKIDDPTLRNKSELLLQTSLGHSLRATKGWSVDSVKRAYTRALQLCKESGFDEHTLPAVFGLWTWNFLRAALGEAQALAEHLVNTAENADDSVFKVLAHEALGFTLFARGKFAAAHAALERSISHV